MKVEILKKLQCVFLFTLQFFFINGQENLSQGPYEQLILRNVTLINGNGAPPIGPIDIEIKQNIILKLKPLDIPEFQKKII